MSRKLEFRKQPSVEELKNTNIYIEYLVNDDLPEECLKRMFYYTSLEDRPGEIYFGMSYRRPEDNSSLKNMELNGQITLSNNQKSYLIKKTYFLTTREI